MELPRGVLVEARKKYIYGELSKTVMVEPLEYPTYSFDAVISVGALSVGHTPGQLSRRIGTHHQARRTQRHSPATGRIREQQVYR